LRRIRPASAPQADKRIDPVAVLVKGAFFMTNLDGTVFDYASTNTAFKSAERSLISPPHRLQHRRRLRLLVLGLRL
jgi:hypothetical protein